MAKSKMSVSPKRGGSHIIGGPETLETKVDKTPEKETQKKKSSKKSEVK